MYWNSNNRPGYKIPVRRAPLGGAPPYPHRSIGPAEAEVKKVNQATSIVEEKPAVETSEEIEWKNQAMRLQAEMENFRKRQTRRAEEAIGAERERLLRLMLPLADNLERALRYDTAENNHLRQGVELTRRELMRTLESEGVTKLETIGQPFAPELHEAIAMKPASAASGTVIEEVEAGYKVGDKLLRPARVVVAE
ncbi:MAG: nucleotide exchange factor GrpE [Anaerolineae bacterium]